MRFPRNVTFMPTTFPSRILKVEMDMRAFVGNWFLAGDLRERFLGRLDVLGILHSRSQANVKRHRGYSRDGVNIFVSKLALEFWNNICFVKRLERHTLIRYLLFDPLI